MRTSYLEATEAAVGHSSTVGHAPLPIQIMTEDEDDEMEEEEARVASVLICMYVCGRETRWKPSNGPPAEATGHN